MRQRTPEGTDTAVEPQASPPSSTLEPHAAYYAAALSVTLAATALLPTPLLRALAAAAGIALALALAPRFLRSATPFSAALLTVSAAVVSVGTVIYLSGLPWETGISWSQAGGVGRPTAWLFTTTSLCFGTGVLASGRLMLAAGRRRGDLTASAYRVASALPVISFVGFAIVAFFRVGGAPLSSAAHNIASWAAFGAFFFGMVGTPWLRTLPRALRHFSAGSAVVVFVTWLPNGLRFMRLYEGRPISMLAMEVVVFPLCLVWFCWLAREWSRG